MSGAEKQTVKKKRKKGHSGLLGTAVLSSYVGRLLGNGIWEELR